MMKFTCDKAKASEVFSSMAKVINRSSINPILKTVKIKIKNGILEAQATNLEISMVSSFGVDNVTDTCEFAVSAERLAAIIASIKDDDITMEYNTKLQIKCCDGQYNILSTPVEDFPIIPRFKGADIECSGIEVSGALKKTGSATMSGQNSFSVLSGVNVRSSDKSILFVGTDGKQLAVKRIAVVGELTSEFNIVLPTNNIGVIDRIIRDYDSIQMSVSTNVLLIKAGDYELASRLIDSKGVDYEKVIPKGNNNKLEISRLGFIDSMKRISLLTTKLSSIVTFDFKGSGVTVSAEESEVGDGVLSLDGKYIGDDLKISFDPVIVMNGVSNFDCDDITIQFDDNQTPMFIQDEQGYLFISMPVVM